MKLTFLLADTYRTQVAIVHEGESRPYGRRSVTIDLTPEQMAAVQRKLLGASSGVDVYEEYLDVFIEHDSVEDKP